MSDLSAKLFSASEEANKLEWEVYERLCTLFPDVVVNDSGHDSYDWSLEVYMGEEVPADWVCNKAQKDEILSWGFRQFWINFHDSTQQYCSAGHLGVRKQAPHTRKADKRAPRPEAQAQVPKGMKLVPDQPVMWRREWDGDVSDEGQWVYAATREELDEYGPWEPLYSEIGPL